MLPKLEGAGAGTLRLPRSALRRGAITWAKILKTARPDGPFGAWSLDGELARPGAGVDPGELPARAVLLECAGSDGSGRGHRRSGVIYILWQLDRQAGEWRELARAVSVDSDWTRDLGPIAKRALEPPRPVLVDPEGATARVLAALERELDPLDPQARRLVLLRVYDQVASRAVGA